MGGSRSFKSGYECKDPDPLKKISYGSETLFLRVCAKRFINFENVRFYRVHQKIIGEKLL
jgi:hypothetical protein